MYCSFVREGNTFNQDMSPALTAGKPFPLLAQLYLHPAWHYIYRTDLDIPAPEAERI